MAITFSNIKRTLTKVTPWRTRWVWRWTSELQLILPSSIRYLGKAECLGMCLILLTVAWKGPTSAGKVRFLLTGSADCQLSCPVLFVFFFFCQWFYLEWFCTDWAPSFLVTNCKSLNKLLPNTVMSGSGKRGGWVLASFSVDGPDRITDVTCHL